MGCAARRVAGEARREAGDTPTDADRARAGRAAGDVTAADAAADAAGASAEEAAVGADGAVVVVVVVVVWRLGTAAEARRGAADAALDSGSCATMDRSVTSTQPRVWPRPRMYSDGGGGGAAAATAARVAALGVAAPGGSNTRALTWL
jgi:hypothetical protein